MSQRALIFAGGHLQAWAMDAIRPGDKLIGADRGALFLIEHHIEPDLAVGDFDSVGPEEAELIKRHAKQFIDCDPVAKNDTDTDLALRLALEMKPRITEIVLIGALGARFDHSLANVHLLKKALDHQVSCSILDEKNEIHLVDPQHPAFLTKTQFSFVSLLPLSPTVTGINLEGFQYPLQNATLELGRTLGISNVLTAPVGRVEAGEGLLLVIQSRD